MGVEASDAQAIEETREAHVAALNKRRRGRLGGRLCQRRRSDAALTKASTEERAPALPIAPRLLLSESADPRAITHRNSAPLAYAGKLRRSDVAESGDSPA
jgi:hypothetical protein